VGYKHRPRCSRRLHLHQEEVKTARAQSQAPCRKVHLNNLMRGFFILKFQKGLFKNKKLSDFLFLWNRIRRVRRCILTPTFVLSKLPSPKEQLVLKEKSRVPNLLSRVVRPERNEV
jgi:hypothetical protein